MAKTIKRIIIEKSFGIILFLIIMWAANSGVKYANNELFTTSVDFFNQNLYALLFIGVLALTAEVLFNLVFPINMFGPILISIIAVFTVDIFIKSLKLVGQLINVDIFEGIENYKYPIYLVVIIFTLLYGYLQLFKGFLDNMDKANEAETSKQINPDIIASKGQNTTSPSKTPKPYENKIYLFANSLRNFFDINKKK